MKEFHYGVVEGSGERWDVRWLNLDWSPEPVSFGSSLMRITPAEIAMELLAQ